MSLHYRCNFEDLDSEDVWSEQSGDEAVAKQTQQELDEDYALAVQLSYEEDGHAVIHRTRRPEFFQAPQRLDPVEQRRREHATKMAIENHIMGRIVAYGPAMPTMLPGGLVQLPPSIRETFPARFAQPAVIRQHAPGTCGSRSVANAAALRDLVARGLPVDAKNIQATAQKYERLHTRNDLSSTDQINLARTLDLHNTYAIGFFQMDPLDKKRINRYPFTVIESSELPMVNLYQESEILENIVRLIRTQKNITANFLCHLDGAAGQAGHGVVVSIVKRAGQPTRMVYMDSNNMPVAVS